MKTHFLKLIVLLILSISFYQQAYPQSSVRDSSFHPYKVNYWVTIPIIVVGAAANFLAIERITHRPVLTNAEINGLNRDIINNIDRWSLDQDPAKRAYYTNFSDNMVTVLTLLPISLVFDKSIRKDWLDVLLIYMETMSITNNLYTYSFLGPTFQGRIRPVAYYDTSSYIPMETKMTGSNRNSFYSGHTATATVACIFMAKVFSDFHPEIGAYKYLLYTAAAIPSLFVGYSRVKSLSHFPSDVMVGFGIGVLCGIIIPELHRVNDKDISLGIYSSPESTGMTLSWKTDFLK